MIRISSLMCLLLYFALSAHAQSIGPSTINTMGKSTTINNITIEQSMGGIVAGNTFVSGTLIVTPGVLQPTVVPATGVNGTTNSTANLITVFPNPTDQIVFVKGNFLKTQAVSCTLTDALGRVLLRRSFVFEQGKERQSIDLAAMAIGQYNLELRWTQSSEDFHRAFKIQKVQ